MSCTFNKSFKIKRFALYLGAAFSLAACGGSSLEKLQGKKEAAANASQLSGTWQSPCESQGGRGMKVVRVFSSTSVTITNESYATPDCSGSPFQELKVDSLYKAECGEPGPIDIAYQSAFLTLRDEAYVTRFNEQKAFGMGNWAVGKSVDVTDKSETQGIEPLIKKGQILYTVFKIIDGKLHHGDFTTGDGSTPATRPKRVKATGDSHVETMN